MGFLDGILSAGSNLLGGFLNNQANEQRTQEQIAAQELINTQNINFQEMFAQNGIQWKVADAQKAGINPLAALGASTASFSNVAAPALPNADTSFGTGVAAAGQDLARAIQSVRSPEDRANAEEKTRLDLESQALDNAIKRQHLASSFAKANQPGNGPGTPTLNQRYLVEGQGAAVKPGTTLVEDKPLKRTVSAPGHPEQEPGAVPEVGYSYQGNGIYTPIQSDDFAKRVSNDWISSLLWAVRNHGMPAIGQNAHPPPVPDLPEGHKMMYDPRVHGYRPHHYRGWDYFGTWFPD